MALAQGAKFLFLDEPPTFLDLAHQMEIIDLVKDLKQRYGKTVVLILHDLNFTLRYVEDKQGRVIASGSPRDVFTVPIPREMFSIEAHLVYGEDGSLSFCARLRSLPVQVSA